MFFFINLLTKYKLETMSSKEITIIAIIELFSLLKILFIDFPENITPVTVEPSVEKIGLYATAYVSPKSFDFPVYSSFVL